MKEKILLVDDDRDILEFLSYNLKKEEYIISTAKNGIAAIEKVKKEKPNLIIMDLMMPGINGIEACKKIRKNPDNKDIIIAFLTARNEDISQIKALESGGDDYITKPIKPKILISKIKSLLRRNNIKQPKQNNKIKIKDIIIDKKKYIITKNNKEIELPKKEFELLSLLASDPDKVFLRTEIFKLVWGDLIIVGDRTIDVHVRKIRQKLGNDIIKTIKGVGYKFS